jgi:hypothetical protein
VVSHGFQKGKMMVEMDGSNGMNNRELTIPRKRIET